MAGWPEVTVGTEGHTGVWFPVDAWTQRAPPGPRTDLYVWQAVIACQRHLLSQASAPKIQASAHLN